MLASFYDALQNATSSDVDLLNIIVCYYLSDVEREWYYNLIQNRQGYKKQVQLGIMYHKKQCKISLTLARVQKKIKTILQELRNNKSDLFYVLTFIKTHGSARQQEVLLLRLWKRSYASMHVSLGISKDTCYSHYSQFVRKVTSRLPKSKTDLFFNKFYKFVN